MKEDRKGTALVARTFVPLPLGCVKPKGWLAKQLRIEADGPGGHLDEFWPYVGDSAWFGGAGDAWERGPYWLDGIVPLAYLLDDPMLIAKVNRCVDFILSNQQQDGWLGPVTYGKGDNESYDAWPAFVALKALTQFQEATNDPRVIPAMTRFFRKLETLLQTKPLFSWGAYRWQDLALSLHWLYERTGEQWLLDLNVKIHDQGFDWQKHFSNFIYTDKVKRADAILDTHVVNNAMAVKQAGVWFRQTHAQSDKDAIYHCIDTLDKYHGTAVGVFTGDEHFAGKSPTQGTELCAVVEYMFSLENLVSFLGDPAFADRLEKIAFNALPATFTQDMWSHQYDQQANQVVCKMSDDKVWETNDSDATLFGMEPNFGCCTANMQQGWPKFAANLWMATPDKGFAAIAYSPCSVSSTLKDLPVRIDVETEYPFDEKVLIKVTSKKASIFPIYLRIPAWAEGAKLTVGEEPVIYVKTGTFHKIQREWKGTIQIALHFPMKVKIQKRYRDAIAIERGPLVYSLRIPPRWNPIRGRFPYTFWELYPTTAWNYALKINAKDPEKSIHFERSPIGQYPFSSDQAPIHAKVKGRVVADWKIEHNAAGPVPQGPVKSAEPMKELELVPYGCAKLRITEFPVLE